MLPDRVSNPGPLTYESGALPIALRGPARLGGLSLPRKSVVRITDRPDMTLDVYRGRKTTMQQQQHVPTLKEGVLPYIKVNGYTSGFSSLFILQRKTTYILPA